MKKSIYAINAVLIFLAAIPCLLYFLNWLPGNVSTVCRMFEFYLFMLAASSAVLCMSIGYIAYLLFQKERAPLKNLSVFFISSLVLFGLILCIALYMLGVLATAVT